MSEVNWNLYFLKDNPFMIMPPADREHVVWAGMPKLKQEIEQKFIAAEQTATTQVILNRGPFGGGKTHAMRYFSFSDNLPKAKKTTRNTYIFTIVTPKNSGKPATDFYTDVLEQISIDRIRETVRSAIQEVGEESGFTKLKEITGSDSLARAILLLCLNSEGDTDKNKLFDVSDISEQNRLLEQYFLEGCTKQDLKKLGLARNISKDQDRFRILAALIHCFIGLVPGRDVKSHSRVCLWIDEMEDFVYFTTSQYRPFTQGLRDLIDRLPAFFSLLLNFTLTDPEEFETLEVIMGKALVDRVTDAVFFREMTLPEALDYVGDLMFHWRTDSFDSKKLSKHYPFENDALKFIIQNLDKRTPRSINKACSKIVEKALSGDKRKSSKTILPNIDLDFVKSISNEELEQEFE